MSAVLVKGLVKRYGAVQTVSGANLTVEEGEIFALLGPNGAGKTTILEILEGSRKRDVGAARCSVWIRVSAPRLVGCGSRSGS